MRKIGIVVVCVACFIYFYNYYGPKVKCPSDYQCSAQIEDFFRSLEPEQANSVEMASNAIMYCKTHHSEAFRKLGEQEAMVAIFDGSTRVKFATKAALISTLGEAGCWLVGR
ncbi:hypothetical protein [Serratia fonticola]|uniref:hypothetical protein n=1 Tax=Serratia fonticola TaxID=47917 RepID=UPI001AE1550C|nr:hypothetical protein [Serratia fonticola]MBP1002397.1 hypothetical protein [Serratia fonticola]